MSYKDVTAETPGEEQRFARIRMFSPMEMDMAFAIAAARDKDDAEKMEQWKRQGDWWIAHMFQ